MRKIVMLATLLGFLGVAGCMDTTTVLTVNKDGTGTLAVQDYFSPQFTEMMSGMGKMAEGMVTEMGKGMGGESKTQSAVATNATKFDFMAETAKSKVNELGP
jgi:hypothetical protein